MANTTPIVTTVTKTTNKENTPKEADAALKANILDFGSRSGYRLFPLIMGLLQAGVWEKTWHYEDILPVVMDKIRRDKRKEVHARLDFGENPRKSRRVREGSQNSSAGTLPARYRDPSERPKIWNRLKYNDEDVFDRLGHRRQSAFYRLSNTYSPSTTKSGLNKGNSRDCSHSRGPKKYVKDPVEIHNIKQRDGETIEEFMERFKIETEHIEGAPKCMRISRFMHGVNNPELTKRLNEHVPKTVEEMMTATTAFIRGETIVPSKNKLRKQIEELVRAGKLSHFIKEIRQDRDQQNTGKKDAPVKDKAAAIYMIWPWGSTRYRSGNRWTCRTPHIRRRRLLDGVRSPSLYNDIIGRHGIREIQAVPSRANAMLKFLVNGGIVTIRSTILTPTECATIATTPKDPAKKAEARHKNFNVAIHPDFPDQEITIGGAVSTKARTELCTLLKGNLDIFTWQPSDMIGVPRSIAEHRLDIREGYSLVKQKKGQAPKRAKAIQVELEDVHGLHGFKQSLSAGLLPLLEIDWKVESLCGYPFKYFLDAYKGYHQIQMAEQDEEKTVFYTSHRVYCYTKMPFGLKNVGATYQRLVDKAFGRQIGQNLEIYVDDLVIKSHTETELLWDIEETDKTVPRQDGGRVTAPIHTNNQRGPEPQWEAG
nr:reverse transcriptase domain-containing protein [Tanacetum cinerariifolium]